MSTSLWTGLILLGLGLSVWLFGNRMWLLGASAGALLGYGLLRLFPGMADGTLGLLIVIGMAILFGVLGFIGKAFASLAIGLRPSPQADGQWEAYFGAFKLGLLDFTVPQTDKHSIRRLSSFRSPQD